MTTTLFLAKIVGPLLVLRGLSIVIDRGHFRAMLDGLDQEATTVSFSLFPVALFMAGVALVLVHDDTSSPAAMLFHVIAWGAILKASLLILFPRLVVRKAMLLGKAGFVPVVAVACLAVGAYLCWFGYVAA
jgi:hypothetical protein